MLLVLSTLYGAYGGIPAFNQLLVRAAFDFCRVQRLPLTVLALTDAPADAPGSPPSPPLTRPPFVRYVPCAGDRRALIAAYLSELGRPLPLVLGHVNLAPLALLWPGPVGLIAHGSEVFSPLPAWSLRRLGLHRATRVAAVSDYTLSCLRDSQRLPAERLCRVINALPVLPPAASPSPSPLGPLRILSISRLHPDEPKGIDALLCALSRLPPADFSLTVIGDGPARPALQALAQALALAPTRVRFLGAVPDAVRDAELDACDVFALPSESEGFGIVYLEALARQKPCLAAQAGGAPEIVLPEVTGLLCPTPVSQHIDALAAALLRLRDPALRRRLGQAGRTLVERAHTFPAFSHAAHAFFQSLRPGQ